MRFLDNRTSLNIPSRMLKKSYLFMVYRVVPDLASLEARFFKLLICRLWFPECWDSCWKRIWCTESVHSLNCHNYKTEPDKKTDKGGLKVWNNDCKNDDQKDSSLYRGDITKSRNMWKRWIWNLYLLFFSLKNSAHENSVKRRPFFSPRSTKWWSWNTVLPNC